MNAARLRAVVDRLLGDEQKLKVQGNFKPLIAALTNIANNPGNQEQQVQAADQLQSLNQRLTEFAGRYQPAEMKRLEEIGATEFFTPVLVDRIRDAIAESPARIRSSSLACQRRRSPVWGWLSPGR